MTRDLPEKFVRLMNECHGARGENWLRRLPEIVSELEEKWSLKAGSPFENLSYHFVAPCISEKGNEFVLKIGFPEEDSPILNETEMLKLYDESSAAKFVDLDENRLALLLERLKPGKTLAEIFRGNEERCVEIAVGALRKIIRKPPQEHNFIYLEEWFAGFKKAEKTGFPADKLKKAQQLYEELSASETFLIHGDFHHENILSATREPFLVIDPKGVIGQIGYEISVFLNNHAWILRNDKNLIEKADGAVCKFSEAFKILPDVLRKWAYAQCVLSAWWTFEENGANWKTDLALADVWKI